MPETYPVTVAVTQRDGSVEHVRVGTATKHGDGFSLQLGELSLGPAEAARPARAAAPRASSGGGDGMVFPPYGRSKGMPILGASEGDLDFYANGCRRTLNDPGKARWHEKERVLLSAIEAEMARQRGEEPPLSDGGDGPPPPGDEDAPF